MTAEETKKKRLQVKYCSSEKELNDFLLTLSTSYLEENLPMLQSIQYVGEVKSTEDKKTINLNSKIIAAVQYFIYVK